jgi:hypothetical protein
VDVQFFRPVLGINTIFLSLYKQRVLHNCVHGAFVNLNTCSSFQNVFIETAGVSTAIYMI